MSCDNNEYGDREGRGGGDGAAYGSTSRVLPCSSCHISKQAEIQSTRVRAEGFDRTQVVVGHDMIAAIFRDLHYFFLALTLLAQNSDRTKFSQT